jgi:TPR repeat protein
MRQAFTNRRFFKLQLMLWVGLYASLASLQTLSAPSRGISVNVKASEAVDAATTETVELYGRSYALVIGNDQYVNGWPKLSNAIRDAEEITAALESRGFEVELHKNLNSDELNGVFKKFFILKGDDPTARLFIWFAGHGATVDGEGYLIPVDAPVPSKGAAFKYSSIALRDFGTYMRQAVSKHVYAVFDSCFAGTVFSSQRALPPSAITRATTLPVRQFLTSGDVDQTVSDDGAFRELFIRAINGDERSDANGDGYVTASELGMFLGDRVTNLTQSLQTPRYGKLRDKDFDRGDFVFVLPGTPIVAGPSAPLNTGPSNSAELAFWDAIKDSSQVQEFDAYLSQYPQGTFASLALLKKSQLVTARTSAQRKARVEEGFKVDLISQDMVATAVANIRQTPYPDAQRVARLETGDSVWAIGETQTKGGTWYKVARDGVAIGFVYAPLLENAKPSSIQTSAASRNVASRPKAPVSNGADSRLSFLVKDLLGDVSPEAGDSANTAERIGADSSLDAFLASREKNGGKLTKAASGAGISQSMRDSMNQINAAEKSRGPSDDDAGDAREAQVAAMIAEIKSTSASESLLQRRRREADNGDANAQLSLGYMYETGEQVTPNMQEAIRWYEKAAASGKVQAMLGLALIYDKDDGPGKDKAAAAVWYEKAAQAGNADAQQTLGYIFENGHGVSRDMRIAARWYEAAARQGKVAAQNNLGRFYQLGVGVDKDAKQAVFWYKKAAAQGSSTAKENLSRLR